MESCELGFCQKVRRQGPWMGTLECAEMKPESFKIEFHLLQTGRRLKSRKDGTCASISVCKSSGRRAQTDSSSWISEIRTLGTVVRSFVSSSRPHGFVLMVFWREGLVVRGSPS
jgi:hypothetical protein